MKSFSSRFKLSEWLHLFHWISFPTLMFITPHLPHLHYLVKLWFFYFSCVLGIFTFLSKHISFSSKLPCLYSNPNTKFLFLLLSKAMLLTKLLFICSKIFDYKIDTTYKTNKLNSQTELDVKQIYFLFGGVLN